MFNAHYDTDGTISFTIHACVLIPFSLLVIYSITQLGMPSLRQLCKIVGRNYHYIMMIVLACMIPFLVVPRTAPGVPITSKFYDIKASDLLTSRTIWFVAENGTNETEAIHVAASSLAYTSVLLHRGSSLDGFLANCSEAVQSWRGRFTLKVKQRISFALQTYGGWSRTDAWSIVDLYSMHAFSIGQLRHLFERAQEQGMKHEWKPQAIIDVGAGRGTLTEILRKSFDMAPAQVYAIETSAPMRKHLTSRGFHAIGHFEDMMHLQLVDMVALLAVLDCCDDPESMVKAAMQKLQPDGVLLIGITLPLCSAVYEGRRGSKSGVEGCRPPRFPFEMHPGAACNRTQSFEFSVAAIVASIFAPLGLDVLAWTRLPYISSGDPFRTHYHLDMALFVVRARAGGGLAGSEIASDEDSSTFVNRMPRPRPPKCNEQKLGIARSWLSREVAALGIKSWGEVLDAGTGFTSLCWLLQERFQSITGVTAEMSGVYGSSGLTSMLSNVKSSVRIVKGNWRDESLLLGRAFDVVVCDYLLGAVELHWPHGADAMLDRLLYAVKPGGYLLVIGLEPYELVLDGKSNKQDAMLLEIEAIGDTAAVLAGRSTYRELPEEWVVRQLQRFASFQIIARSTFPLSFQVQQFAQNQLEFAEGEVRRISDKGLRQAFNTRIMELRALARKHGTHAGSHEYAILAKRNAQA